MRARGRRQGCAAGRSGAGLVRRGGEVCRTLPAANPLARRGRAGDRGSLRLRNHAVGLRPSPVRRGPALRDGPGVRRATARGGGHRGGALLGLGAERSPGFGRRRLQRLGRTTPPDAAAPFGRGVGTVRPAARSRRALQVRDRGRRRRDRAEGRPARPADRAAAGHRVGGCAGGRLLLVRQRLDVRTCEPPCARGADLHLRSPCRFVDEARWRGRSRVRLGGPDRAIDSLCSRHGLHPHRAAADHGASVRRIVGLPAAVAVRAFGPFRGAAGLRRVRRRLPPRGARRDPRLGAGALPDRSARSGPVRRHPSLRAFGPSRGLPPGLEHAHLQPRAQRGLGLPARLGGLVARNLPRRRTARRCGCLDALPRLQPQCRRVGAQRPRRTRESRIGRLPQAPEHDRLGALPGSHYCRRGIRPPGRA